MDLLFTGRSRASEDGPKPINKRKIGRPRVRELSVHGPWFRGCLEDHGSHLRPPRFPSPESLLQAWIQGLVRSPLVLFSLVRQGAFEPASGDFFSGRRDWCLLPLLLAKLWWGEAHALMDRTPVNPTGQNWNQPLRVPFWSTLHDESTLYHTITIFRIVNPFPIDLFSSHGRCFRPGQNERWVDPRGVTLGPHGSVGPR
jgi:hypothetical protein